MGVQTVVFARVFARVFAQFRTGFHHQAKLLQQVDVWKRGPLANRSQSPSGVCVPVPSSRSQTAYNAPGSTGSTRTGRSPATAKVPGSSQQSAIRMRGVDPAL